ncbi:hypothetical protein SAMN03159353_10696 [Cedecea sp. NFIX57]|nr:hypothetical protein SAMN03159353_10696 [Cedecea sp. NFIX57]
MPDREGPSYKRQRYTREAFERQTVLYAARQGMESYTGE